MSSNTSELPREDDSTLTAVLRAEAAKHGRLRLLVVGDGVYATHPLPDSGDLTIGRSDRADVCIDDPLISRRHAVLHVGPRLQIEDLGSSNGLRVRDVRLSPNQIVELSPGDTIDLGSTTLIVQRAVSSARPRRVWTHGAFEARLEDECARAERSGATFALVRLHVAGPLPSAAVQDTLSSELRSVDVVATYGPGEYEVLLVDTPELRSAEVAQRLAGKLEERGAKARTGVACYPRDGTSPEELVAKACAVVRGGADAGAPIVVSDGAMQRLHKLVKRIAVGTISVLLLGETGVGKEVLAETLHRESPRAGKPFLRLNCAALSESLLESELFGHERGSFTGAIQTKPGLLETAQGGSVFLDEVGELPMSIQVKLLRVIEERQVYRVGGLKPRSIDVRFIAATNRDLEAEVAFGSFRQDLFFRLNGISLVIPPLRERVDEIESLARAFATQAATHQRRPTPAFGADALAALKRYSWPGNIRELRNVVERAVLLSGDSPITTEHLPMEKMASPLAGRASSPPSVPRNGPPSRPGLPMMMLGPGGPVPRYPQPSHVDRDGVGRPPVGLRGWDTEDTQAPPTMRPAVGSTPPPVTPLGPMRSKVGEEEKKRILEALERCAGNQTKAAKLLGISRRTLVSRLETYQLPRPRKNEDGAG